MSDLTDLLNRVKALGPRGDSRIVGAMAVMHPEALLEAVEVIERTFPR